ncbi:MAG TPA: hypothetical protein ENK04_00980 [Gammaproteobacteria bacterium]|nr:hypothetical protein [Gammaproteobacteria bacterium]
MPFSIPELTKSNFAFSWLSNETNLGEEFIERFNRLKHADLKVSRAWAIKELFRDFWSYTYAGWSKRHFDKWHSWAMRRRLKPIKEKAWV